MNDFKWRHYQGAIILGCVKWYCKYRISYRDLKEMMIERGVEVDHIILYRWVQHYAPLILKRLSYYWRPSLGRSWRVDETYIKVKGQWKHLYRAVDKHGRTIDFYLPSRRNINAAKCFLSTALRKPKDWEIPSIINTDKAASYHVATKELKEEGTCPHEEKVR